MRLRYKLGTLLTIVLGVFLFGRCGKPLHTSPGTATPLPINDKEQLVFDPRTHTITIKRPGKTVITHLPDRPSIVDIRRDGTVSITASQFGLEHRLFLGAGYSDKLRGGIGIDGLYWKALDLAGGLQLDMTGRSPRAFVGLSYTIKDNLRITATVDHTEHVGAMLTLRI